MEQHKRQIELASRLLKLTVEEVNQDSVIIDSNGALYYSKPVKGGNSLIVGKDGSVLYANSSINYDEHMREFENGRRTPLEAFEN